MNMHGIGIWGAGHTAMDHLVAYLAQPDCRVVAIGSLSLADAQVLASHFGLECACYSDYDAFLAHPGLEIISICTPHYIHPENAIAGLQAGKHLYVEKPICVTLADLYEIRQAVQSTGLKLVTGFVVRWIPLVMRLRELVHSGVFGEIRVVDVDFWHSRQRPSYYRRRATGGSAMLLGGCHAVDTAMFLTGSTPVEIVARSVQIGTDSEDTYEFDCAEVCLVRYSTGAIGRISAVVNGHMPYQFNIDLLGDTGTARNNRIFLREDTEETGFRTLSDAGIENAKATRLPYDGVIRQLLDSIESKTDPDVGIEQAVRTHELCFGAMLSERTGHPVTLPLSEQDQQRIHQLQKEINTL